MAKRDASSNKIRSFLEIKLMLQRYYYQQGNKVKKTVHCSYGGFF